MAGGGVGQQKAEDVDAAGFRVGEELEDRNATVRSLQRLRNPAEVRNDGRRMDEIRCTYGTNGENVGRLTCASRYRKFLKNEKSDTMEDLKDEKSDMMGSSMEIWCGKGRKGFDMWAGEWAGTGTV